MKAKNKLSFDEGLNLIFDELPSLIEYDKKKAFINTKDIYQLIYEFFDDEKNRYNNREYLELVELIQDEIDFLLKDFHFIGNENMYNALCYVYYKNN